MGNNIDDLSFSFMFLLVYMVLWEGTGVTWLLHQLIERGHNPSWNIRAQQKRVPATGIP